MWASRPSAPANIPEAMVDFVTLLASLVKDPDLLTPMVKAAEDIAAANAMTEEERKALAGAQDMITQTTLESNRLSADRSENEATKKALQRALDDIGVRERALDKQNGSLASAQRQVGEDASALRLRESRVSSREDAVGRQEQAQAGITAQLEARERAITKRENALRKAAGMVQNGDDG